MMNWSVSTSAAGDEAIVINTPSKDLLLTEVEAHLAARKGFAVATLNLDHAVKLRRDPAFAAAYRRHSHVVADGNPVVWLSRLAGQRAELAPGSDLVEPVAGLAARLGVPVALVGSTEAVLERTAAALEGRHPGLTIVARIAPPMGFDARSQEAEALIERLAASKAGLCFLAMGSPRQEVFAAHARERLPQTGFLSIGAGLDFIAGAQARAPRWVRALAAEWLWRLARSPRRLASRYAACILILPILTATALASRRRAPA